MNYEIVFSKSARKELSKIEPVNRQKIADSINELSEQPRPYGYIKLKDDSEGIYRIRAGDYSILYSIDDMVSIIEIRKVGTRKVVYDAL
ncbi:MAG: type II toxin-antitoxin system RelE/ParE family toxin [Chitinophagaceae bacterium]|jgi:mRNA interferase RelE/StbE|nr:type II toxin-antitoxin system RelE/ParE family toxin [Chitinophagaceae bacterium]